MEITIFLLLLSTFLALPTSYASSPLTLTPAFVWSNHRSIGHEIQGVVDYRTFSPQSLTETLLYELGWSKLVCPKLEQQQEVEMLLAFVGNQLRTVDIARDADVDLELIRLLKESFSSSNYSMALPYVAVPDERLAVLHRLLSTINDKCDHGSRHGELVVVGPCFDGSLDFEKIGVNKPIKVLDVAEGIQYIEARKTTRTNSETDILVVCMASSLEVQTSQNAGSEGEVLAKVLSALRQSGTSHSVLYTSDPVEADKNYTFRRRQLAFQATNTTSSCDAVCEAIATFYEGLIVGIVLLIILISGLCCMMGIDTPTRFETARES